MSKTLKDFVGHWAAPGFVMHLIGGADAPCGFRLLGLVSETTGSGTEAYFEFLRFELAGEAVAFFAYPRGRACGDYKLIETKDSGRTLVFEDVGSKERRITWQIAADGQQLHATMEGETHGIEAWTFNRAVGD